MATKPDSSSDSSKPSGRFTPKTTKDPGAVRDVKLGAAAPVAHTSGRYTPPKPPTTEEAEYAKLTKPWVPYLMFGFLAIGLILIVLNYMTLLPKSPSNWYLLGGIVAITGGFVSATKLY